MRLLIAMLASCREDGPLPTPIDVPESVGLPTTCGSGDWGLVEAPDDALYVLAGAAEGGTGSTEAPFATISEAVASVGPNTAVVVGTGRYAESVTLERDQNGLHIIGRCPQAVVVEPAESEWVELPTASGEWEPGRVGFLVDGGGHTIEGLAIEGGDVGAYVNSGTLNLVGVSVSGSSWDGAYVDGSTLTLDAVEITGTGGGLFGENGAGIRIFDGTLKAWDSFITSAGGRGLYAEDSVVELTDVTIADSRPTPAGKAGHGTDLRGSTAEFHNCQLSGSSEIGLFAAESTLTMDGGAVTSTRPGFAAPTATGVYGLGLLTYASTVTLDGVNVADNAGGGMYASDSQIDIISCEFSESDSVFSPAIYEEGEFNIEVEGLTLTMTSFVGGTGLYVFAFDAPDTSAATVRDSTFRGFTNRGIRVENSSLDVSSSQIIATGAEGSTFAVGILVDGGHLTARNTSVEETRGAGIFLQEASGEVYNVSITDTLDAPATSLALGLVVQLGSELTAESLSVANSDGPGSFLSDSELTCHSCTFAGNQFAGLAVIASDITLDAGSTFENNRPDEGIGGGIGLYFAGAVGSYARSLIVEDTSFGPHAAAAIYASAPANLSVTNTTFQGDPNGELGWSWPQHNGIFAGEGIESCFHGDGLCISDSSFTSYLGDAIFLDGASATIESSTFDSNSTDVYQQRCDGVARAEISAEISAEIVAELCSNSTNRETHDIPFYVELPGLEAE